MESEQLKLGEKVTEWILAFDAGCGRCNEVIDGISGVAGERLMVAGLGEERIRGLRKEALGEHPPFAPTLLAVDPDRVRAWTGPQMSMRLSLLLGPTRSLAVVRALNRMDVVVHGDRRRFLKAAPAVALGAFLLSGGFAAPAMAAPGRRATWAEAQEWAAQLDQLPIGYDDVVALPLLRRRAVFAALPRPAKQALWAEHLHRFRRARPNLNVDQAAVLSEATTLMPAVLGASATSDTHAKSDHLKDKAIAAFGADAAYAALAMLGTPEPESRARAEAVAASDCWCSTESSWCGSGYTCKRYGNCQTTGGCGNFWGHDCDGNACVRFG